MTDRVCHQRFMKELINSPYINARSDVTDTERILQPKNKNFFRNNILQY